MTLTEVLAAHQFVESGSLACMCDAELWHRDGLSPEEIMAAHQAEAIAAAGLAVVELPKPLHGGERPVWRVVLDGEPEDVYVGNRGGVTLSGIETFDERDIPELTAALLAAHAYVTAEQVQS